MANKSGDSDGAGEADFFNKLVEEQAAEKAPAPAFLGAELSQQTQRVLATLTPREEAILRQRFGISEQTDHTLEEVGQDFEVTRERIRQIEQKALARLRDPKNSARLASFIASDASGATDESEDDESDD